MPCGEFGLLSSDVRLSDPGPGSDSLCPPDADIYRIGKAWTPLGRNFSHFRSLGMELG